MSTTLSYSTARAQPFFRTGDSVDVTEGRAMTAGGKRGKQPLRSPAAEDDSVRSIYLMIGIVERFSASPPLASVVAHHARDDPMRC